MINITIPLGDIEDDDIKEITEQLTQLFQYSTVTRTFDAPNECYKINVIIPHTNNNDEYKETENTNPITEYLNAYQQYEEEVDELCNTLEKQKDKLKNKLSEQLNIPEENIIIHGNIAFIKKDYITNKFIKKINQLEKHWYIDLCEREISIYLSEERKTWHNKIR